MKTELIRQIIETYGKHGWQLSRVLLSDATRQNLTNTAIFGDAQIEQSAIDAVWVSRPSANDRQAWELRLLSENPFALFETFAADLPQAARDEKLREIESRLIEKVNQPKSANNPKSEKRDEKKRKK